MRKSTIIITHWEYNDWAIFFVFCSSRSYPPLSSYLRWGITHQSVFPLMREPMFIIVNFNFFYCSCFSLKSFYHLPFHPIAFTVLHSNDLCWSTAVCVCVCVCVKFSCPFIHHPPKKGRAPSCRPSHSRDNHTHNGARFERPYHLHRVERCYITAIIYIH
jgi:hypothetical protein